FLILTVPPAPDGRPTWQANRGVLTQYFQGAVAIAIASLDAMDPDARAVLSEPAAELKDDTEERRIPPVPSFLYTTRSMAEAALGAPLSGLKRGFSPSPSRTVNGWMRFY